MDQAGLELRDLPASAPSAGTKLDHFQLQNTIIFIDRKLALLTEDLGSQHPHSSSQQP